MFIHCVMHLSENKRWVLLDCKHGGDKSVSVISGPKNMLRQHFHNPWGKMKKGIWMQHIFISVRCKKNLNHDNALIYDLLKQIFSTDSIKKAWCNLYPAFSYSITLMPSLSGVPENSKSTDTIQMQNKPKCCSTKMGQWQKSL